jgi:hypothetical protein
MAQARLTGSLEGGRTCRRPQGAMRRMTRLLQKMEAPAAPHAEAGAKGGRVNKAVDKSKAFPV